MSDRVSNRFLSVDKLTLQRMKNWIEDADTRERDAMDEEETIVEFINRGGKECDVI